MQWEEKAKQRIEKAPFFIRKKIKKQVEDYVASAGRSIVTSDDITAAKNSFFGKKPNGRSAEEPGDVNENIPVTQEEINRLEKMVESGGVMDGLETKYYQIKLCGGAAGCPLSTIDDKKAAEIVKKVIIEEDLAGYIEKQLTGRPVLAHHKFKAAISGCPNSCSEPQIKDFAIIGQSKPFFNSKDCTECGICIKICREDGLELADKKITVLADNCLNCGMCIEACPKDLFKSQTGYKIVIGGRLGRRPILARTLIELADESELEHALRQCIRIYKEHGTPGKRFSHVVDKLGIEKIKAEII